MLLLCLCLCWGFEGFSESGKGFFERGDFSTICSGGKDSVEFVG